MAQQLLRTFVRTARAITAVAAVAVMAGCGSVVPVTGLVKAAAPTCATCSRVSPRATMSST